MFTIYCAALARGIFRNAYYVCNLYVLRIYDFDNTYCCRMNGTLTIFPYSIGCWKVEPPRSALWASELFCIECRRISVSIHLTCPIRRRIIRANFNCKGAKA